MSTTQAALYPREVYDRLIDLGMRENSRIVDLGCGSGQASYPLIGNGFAVTGIDNDTTLLAAAKASFPNATWKDANPEATGLPAQSCDAVVSGDALHRFDMGRCVAEGARILSPGGIFSAWWRTQMSEDPVSDECIAAAQESGFAWVSSGLVRGFREFYAASELRDQSLRVIPSRIAARLSEIVAQQRMRPEIMTLCKGDTSAYAKRLKKRLDARFGDGDPYQTNSYLIFMYTGIRNPA